ncbi:MAG: beta-lactamase family protein, partial [Oscillospiraceae bacterium]|nr:beta-lactamase family protein [Oscillospiraceae bacterium]
MNKRIIAGIAALCLTVMIVPVSAENAADNTSAKSAVSTVPDDTEYVYNIASVSKVYTTAAVMQLADEGKIDIDRPVTDYLPGFSLADERYRDITVRMLMDHTSGIMGSTRTNEGFFDDNDRFHHDTLLEYLSAQRLKADPGKYAAYCNDGFDLLELIIENVSGMSYTEYIKANIADRVGAVSTGTGVDMLGIPTMVPAVLPNGLHYETAYLMESGTGGVYATASDVALFGASFFTGNDSVLSEGSKNAMGTRHNDNEFSDDNGLGWDFTDLPRYERYGIKTLHKGGDGSSDHAWLLSAPDEQISVAVLSGNGSSTYNGMVASALLDAALAEKGIIIEDVPLPECEIVNNIPDEYTKFAGWYGMDIESQDSLCSISFQDNKYLHMERTNHRRTECTDYVLTADGDFAELEYEVSETINADGSFDMRLAAGGSSRISFEENADGIYIKMACINSYPGLGSYENKTYIGQKIEEN